MYLGEYIRDAKGNIELHKKQGHWTQISDIHTMRESQ